MTRTRTFSPLVIAVLIGIGCGSSKPQDAAAKANRSTPSESAPIRLAEAPASSQPAAATGGSATVTVTVKLDGQAPKRETVKMGADPVCAQQHTSPVFAEDVVVNEQGMLQNVFVYAKEGVKGAYPPSTQPVVLDQSGCWYKPHVLALQAGQPLEIVNSDATLHNVNAKPTVNQPFNVAQPKQGMKTTKSFAKAEVGIKFKCNVHPWMNAYAGVVEHPFFGVTDQSGATSIKGLPAGTYVFEAWHEKYGTQTQTVTVADGETKSVTFAFKAQ